MHAVLKTGAHSDHFLLHINKAGLTLSKPSKIVLPIQPYHVVVLDHEGLFDDVANQVIDL